jgi:hypothetical protein
LFVVKLHQTSFLSWFRNDPMKRRKLFLDLVDFASKSCKVRVSLLRYSLS